MITLLRNATMSLVVLTVLTGVAYPLAVTAIVQAVLPDQANGSVVTRQGQAVGSSLIGQGFTDAKHFWGRPSATSPYPNATLPSGAANKGPSSDDLKQAAADRAKALHEADPDNKAAIPVELVAASGSGIDPHISPAAARYQVARVAKARGMSEAAVQALVDQATSDRQLAVLGEPVVNVLELNLRLDGRW